MARGTPLGELRCRTFPSSREALLNSAALEPFSTYVGMDAKQSGIVARQPFLTILKSVFFPEEELCGRGSQQGPIPGSTFFDACPRWEPLLRLQSVAGNCESGEQLATVLYFKCVCTFGRLTQSVTGVVSHTSRKWAPESFSFLRWRSPWSVAHGKNSQYRLPQTERAGGRSVSKRATLLYFCSFDINLEK